MCPMPCSFFSMLRTLRKNVEVPPYIMQVVPDMGFPIHPSASELAEQMLVDSDVLKNETYEPGIYDEDGDYYPQYTDDPAKLPEFFEPAPLESGDTVPESSPAEKVDVSTGEVKESE